VSPKRDKIVEAAKQFIHDGQLNLSKLRRENISLYVRICAVFDSIDDFKELIKPIECVYVKERTNRNKVRYDTNLPDIENRSLRNLLAFEKLSELHNVMTYEQISSKYDVSKQAVHELHKRLNEFFHSRLTDTNAIDYNQNTL
jgi:hypothetical protein